MSFSCGHELIGDTNTTHHVWMFYKFQIVIVLDINFLKIYNLSKVLNNKDNVLNMKPSYRENLANAHQIWDVYEKLLPNLDTFLQHSKKYKVFNENPSSHANAPLWNAFTNLVNTCTPFEEMFKLVLNIESTKECKHILLLMNAYFENFPIIITQAQKGYNRLPFNGMGTCTMASTLAFQTLHAHG